MYKAKRIIKGLQIFIDLGSCSVCAEHDVIYAGSSKELPSEKKAELEELGWFWNDHADSWAIYT